MAHAVETMAYRLEGGLPWHGLGVPVDNDITIDDMLVRAGLDWSVSKRALYYPKRTVEGAPTELRIAPEEYALIRDSDEVMLDTVGANYKPVQNRDVLDFFKRFVKAGDMQMETAGSLKGGKFIWALARINESFKIGGKHGDETRGYLLLSQPHQFGFSMTAALTPVRVVCWNTINYALGSKLDGSSGGRTTASFRMDERDSRPYSKTRDQLSHLRLQRQLCCCRMAEAVSTHERRFKVRGQIMNEEEVWLRRDEVYDDEVRWIVGDIRYGHTFANREKALQIAKQCDSPWHMMPDPKSIEIIEGFYIPPKPEAFYPLSADINSYESAVARDEATELAMSLITASTKLALPGARTGVVFGAFAIALKALIDAVPNEERTTYMQAISILFAIDK